MDSTDLMEPTPMKLEHTTISDEQVSDLLGAAAMLICTYQAMKIAEENPEDGEPVLAELDAFANYSARQLARIVGEIIPHEELRDAAASILDNARTDATK